MKDFKIDFEKKKLISQYANQCKFDELKKIIHDIPRNSPIDSDGNTLLGFFAKNRLEDAASWILINETDIDTTIKNFNGETALHISVMNQLHGLTTFLCSKPGANETTSEKRNCLALSVLKGDILMTNILLETGFSSDEVDIYGFSALGYSFLLQNLDIAKVLFNFGSLNGHFCIKQIPVGCPCFPFDVSFPYSINLLHLSVISGNIDFLILGLKFGIDPKETDSMDNSPFDLSIKLRIPDFIYILSALQSKNPIFEAIHGGEINDFSRLIEDLGHTVDSSGQTPLHYAVKYGQKQMIDILAPLYPPIPDFYGHVPLNFLSTSNSNSEILIEYSKGFPSFGQSCLAPIYMENKSFRVSIIVDLILREYQQYMTILQECTQDIFKQNKIFGVILRIIDIFPSLKRHMILSKKSLDFMPVINDINTIISSSEIDLFIEGQSERVTNIRNKSSDEKGTLSLLLAFSQIIIWARLLQRSIKTIGTILDQTYSLHPRIQNLISCHKIIDESVSIVLSQGKNIEYPTITNPLMTFRIQISASKIHKIPCELDLLIRSQILALFRITQNDRSLMLPPSYHFVDEGTFSLLLCENSIILISQGKKSYSIPLFGLYIHPQRHSATSLRLIWHSGTIIIDFENRSNAKSFVAMFNILVSKYTIPEFFLKKEDSKQFPIWMIFSYMKTDSIIPHIVLKGLIVKNNREITHKCLNHFENIEMLDSSSIRCISFNMQMGKVSLSLL